MAGSNGVHRLWAVGERGDFVLQAKSLAARAAAAGLATEFAGTLRSMLQSLRHDPEHWGDPVRDLLHGPGTYYRHYDRLLTVTSTVHPASGDVFLQNISASPGSPLEGA